MCQEEVVDKTEEDPETELGAVTGPQQNPEVVAAVAGLKQNMLVLKSSAYDTLAHIEFLQKKLSQTNQQIAHTGQELEKLTGTPIG